MVGSAGPPDARLDESIGSMSGLAALASGTKGILVFRMDAAVVPGLLPPRLDHDGADPGGVGAIFFCVLVVEGREVTGGITPCAKEPEPAGVEGASRGDVGLGCRGGLVWRLGMPAATAACARADSFGDPNPGSVVDMW